MRAIEGDVGLPADQPVGICTNMDKLKLARINIPRLPGVQAESTFEMARRSVGICGIRVFGHVMVQQVYRVSR